VRKIAPTPCRVVAPPQGDFAHPTGLLGIDVAPRVPDAVRHTSAGRTKAEGRSGRDFTKKQEDCADCYCNLVRLFMIDGFHHKGLRRLFEGGDRKLLPADLVARIATLLAYLDAAKVIDDLDIPSLRLHPLKGKFKGYWAITVRANLAHHFSLCRRNSHGSRIN
jgi:proteic killer suppression protein